MESIIESKQNEKMLDVFKGMIKSLDRQIARRAN